MKREREKERDVYNLSTCSLYRLKGVKLELHEYNTNTIRIRCVIWFLHSKSVFSQDTGEEKKES